jgi:hypothetical protein
VLLQGDAPTLAELAAAMEALAGSWQALSPQECQAAVQHAATALAAAAPQARLQLQGGQGQEQEQALGAITSSARLLSLKAAMAALARQASHTPVGRPALLQVELLVAAQPGAWLLLDTPATRMPLLAALQSARRPAHISPAALLACDIGTTHGYSPTDRLRVGRGPSGPDGWRAAARPPARPACEGRGASALAPRAALR